MRIPVASFYDHGTDRQSFAHELRWWLIAAWLAPWQTNYTHAFEPIMSLYDLHDAQLNDFEGEGFAYSQKTVYGKAYKGVFFADQGISIEDLAEKDDDAEFQGILYDRSREREKSFSVEITDVISTPSGDRADFVATEKP